jgi:hypothetical protein
MRQRSSSSGAAPAVPLDSETYFRPKSFRLQLASRQDITTTGIPFFSISLPILAPLRVPVPQVAVKITHASRWFSMCQVDADFPRVEILAQSTAPQKKNACRRRLTGWLAIG